MLINKYLAPLAQMYNAHPSESSFVIIVTGTSDTTMTAKILYRLLQHTVGTTALCTHDECRIGEQMTSKVKYTPFGLQSFVSLAKAGGCQSCIFVMEEQDLADDLHLGLSTDMGILTTIETDNTETESDIHTKVSTFKKLFYHIITGKKSNKISLLPKDDRYTRTRTQELAFSKSINFGILSNASIKAGNIQTSPIGTTFDCNYLNTSYPFSTPGFGQSAVYATIASIGAGIVIGLQMPLIKDILSKIPSDLIEKSEILVNAQRNYHFYSFPPRQKEKNSTVIPLSNALQKIRERANVANTLFCIYLVDGSLSDEEYQIFGKTFRSLSDAQVITQSLPIEQRSKALHASKQILDGTEAPEGDKVFLIPDHLYAYNLVNTLAQPGDNILICTHDEAGGVVAIKQDLQKIL